MYIIALVGASGSGKSTLIDELCLTHRDNYSKYISYTTREPRENERDGYDYWFISKRLFEHLAATGFFVEIVEFDGHYYGSGSDVLDMRTKTLIAVVPKGLEALRKGFGSNVIAVHIAASKRDLRERSRYREHRNIKKELEEISKVEDFDFAINTSTGNPASRDAQILHKHIENHIRR